MANKVNGIKIYPKHSLGSILCASFGVFAGFMLIIGLTFFPIFGATINGELMQVNAVDFIAYCPTLSLLGLDSIFSGMTGFTHFLAPSKYNDTFFEYVDLFKSGAADSGNYAVFWYGDAAQYGLDIILSVNYLLLMFFGLFLFIEGIIRLATGTFQKTARAFTIVCFFLMLFFIISSFFTNFCLKYIALEMMEEGETYVPKVCPMQYILFFILLACSIVQHCVYNSTIKGKLYVADARLIKGQKEPVKEPKRSKKDKKATEEVTEEEIVEETPAEEPASEAPVEEKSAPTEEPTVEEVAEEQPVAEPIPEPTPEPVPEAPKEEPAPVEAPIAEPAPEAPAEEKSAPFKETKAAPKEAKKSE